MRRIEGGRAERRREGGGHGAWWHQRGQGGVRGRAGRNFDDIVEAIGGADLEVAGSLHAGECEEITLPRCKIIRAVRMSWKWGGGLPLSLSSPAGMNHAATAANIRGEGRLLRRASATNRGGILGTD